MFNMQKAWNYLYINNCIFTFVGELLQNNARSPKFWWVKCMNTNPKGECIGQASKLKQKCIILSQFSSTR